MNNVQQAIRDAAEKGGYRYRWWKVNDLEHSEGYNGLQLRALSEHLHDPDFWKALAKARKWEDANAWRFHWHQAVQSLSECARRERPRGSRAAEQRDEVAPLHSITSSALVLACLRKSYDRTPTTLLAITASTIVKPNSAICTGSSI